MTRYEAQRMAAEDAYDAAHRCDCGGMYETVCDDTDRLADDHPPMQQCETCLDLRHYEGCECPGCERAHERREWAREYTDLCRRARELTECMGRRHVVTVVDGRPTVASAYYVSEPIGGCRDCHRSQPWCECERGRFAREVG
jgi:hypothetical protein